MTDSTTPSAFPMHPGTPARWEWLVVGLVTLACVIYWIAHFHQFTVASPDTYSYVSTSRALWDGDLPDNFKRMPLFPALIGLVAKVMPGAEPEIEAALVLNILFAAGTLLLVYAVARRITGWAAIVPVAMMAIATETHLAAGQPLLDPLVGFMVVLSFWLFLRRSRWLHVALFGLALTRYECAAMIGVVFLADCFERRRLWRPLVFAAGAASGWAIWMFLSLRSGPSGGGNAYLDEMESMGWTINLSFLERVVEVSFQRLDVVLWSTLACLGLTAVWGRDRSASAVILGFFALYVVAHVVFSVVVDRYVYPVIWVLPLYAAVGMEATVDWIRRRVGPHARAWHGPALTVIAAVLAIGGVIFYVEHVRMRSGVTSRFVYLGLPAAVLVACFGLLQVVRRRPAWPPVIVGCLLVALLGRQAGVGTRLHAATSWKQRYNHYESYLAGKWLEAHLVAGERALVAQVGMTDEYSDLPPKALFAVQRLRASSIEELPSELADHGVVYVIYQYYRLPSDARRAALQLPRFRPDLLEHFAHGDPVPGFEHVTTLPIPRRAGRADVQIYRLAP